MRTLARIGLGAGGALVLLAAVMGVRTARLEAPVGAALDGGSLAGPVAVDVNAAAQRLSQAIRFRTVSHQDKAEDQPAEWDRFHAWLQSAYPAAHAAMTREVIFGHTLIYTWKGSEPSLAPIVLMAHQDVVPVTPGTEKDWRHPPFDGVVADGAVWGRGAIDDKGSLISLFEGAELLAAQGFTPRRTVLLVSTHDEEARGEGAPAVADWMKARGLQAEFVLDEGMAVISDNPVTGDAVALIGVAEKGYGTLKVVARAPGGHSSSPPRDAGGAVLLSRAVVAIAEHPFPLEFKGPGAALLETLAPTGPWALRMAVANRWLFEPLILQQVAATPTGAGLLHTTIAPTMLRGSPKENVLPQDATAWINYRIAPGDTSETVLAHTRAAVGELPVELSWTKTPDEPTPISSTRSRGWNVLAALAGEMTRAPVSPGLVTAATDSRHLRPVATDVYRFQPMTFSLASLQMIHGTNEHLTLENLEFAVGFYARLIATAAR
ncbi:M20/M25/M40 family peptidase [Cystobacter fuscus DSM 2262]|uniref:M20/M25/M40 family peptidase n=1 Tax=Cystobacter fuscus (strain ATCC 25194 / DSM 2262 / NBRC 100088 / M29) TaxID=1242864 RepID=S9PFA6_CYSF2|nr:M20 family peptidase [Cystobacter fuscus]EPX61731.1 M20/M25/M40 family peptidase [Cystobacter fuscus DSM 2262]